MMITIPFVVFGVFRYLLLMHRRDLGEEPEEVLLRDVPILLCIAGWAVAAAVILAAGLLLNLRAREARLAAAQKPREAGDPGT